MKRVDVIFHFFIAGLLAGFLGIGLSLGLFDQNLAMNPEWALFDTLGLPTIVSGVLFALLSVSLGSGVGVGRGALIGLLSFLGVCAILILSHGGGLPEFAIAVFHGLPLIGMIYVVVGAALGAYLNSHGMDRGER